MGLDPPAQTDIDASRWSRSLGIASRCTISASALRVAAPPSPAARAEDIAAAAMSILGCVRRALSAGAQFPFRVDFRRAPGDVPQELEALFEQSGADARVLFVRVPHQRVSQNQTISPEGRP